MSLEMKMQTPLPLHTHAHSDQVCASDHVADIYIYKLCACNRRVHVYVDISPLCAEVCASSSRCVHLSMRCTRRYVSFTKEPYKRDDIQQKRPIILRSLLMHASHDDICTPRHKDATSSEMRPLQRCRQRHRDAHTCVCVCVCVWIYGEMHT